MGTFRPLSLFEPEFPSTFRGMLAPLWMNAEPGAPEMKIDVEEADDRYVVKADMPGVAKEDIHVDVDGNLVSIAGEVRREKKEEKDGKVLRSERYFGSMSRAFTLPTGVDVAKVEAKYADGVLRLTLPKSEGTPTHRIEIH